MNKLTILGTFLGASLGFAYWEFVGCQGGSCPIWSSKWTSALHCAALGGLIFSMLSTKLSAQHKMDFKNISQEETLLKMQEQNVVILDVRTPSEFAEGHLESAINIDFYASDFEDKLQDLDATKTYVVYCKSGGRSANAAGKMATLGINHVFNVLGGFSVWKGKIAK